MADGEGEKKADGGGGGGKDKDKARGEKLQPGPAATTVISLSQILLAPLDALFKAQVHAARSFLNFVMQLSYPHVPTKKDNETAEETKYREEQERKSKEIGAFSTTFGYREQDEKGKDVIREIDIPTIALVPLKPLAVEEASFKLSMAVSDIGRHRQLRKNERGNDDPDKPKDPPPKDPPWYLVDDPISLRGVVAPPQAVGKHQGREDALKDLPAATIDIEVKVGVAALPAGLDKLLTRMTQSQSVRRPPSDGNASPPGGAGAGPVKQSPAGGEKS
ncbi:MAG TPA: DUF2589 domain-containing protein [Myxococcaceae bacterium]|nr:DUF2589 domain-containing protein [Myxococcaceae bacterium]